MIEPAHITTGQRDRQGQRLDRRAAGEAGRFQAGKQRRVQVERGKNYIGQRFVAHHPVFIVIACVLAQWIVDADVPEELVYQMTKALWEQLEVLKGGSAGQKKSGVDFMSDVHAKGKDVKLETALTGNAIPLHPGAEKYYKEIGLIK